MKFETKKSDIHGTGVFTLVPLKKNTTLILLDTLKDNMILDLGKDKGFKIIEIGMGVGGTIKKIDTYER